MNTSRSQGLVPLSSHGPAAHRPPPEGEEDDRFAVGATEARGLTQDGANDGNRGKAIRGGIATFRFNDLNARRVA
jgi:hypothetical protein